MNANLLRALALMFPVALFAAGCGGGDQAGHHHDNGHHHDDGHDHSADDAQKLTCPPCGMKMDADTELVELDGLKFALCSELCEEKVAEKPQHYAMYAVQ